MSDERSEEGIESIELLAQFDVIRNRRMDDCGYLVERLECGEPVITTRSGKIRIPASEYEKHWINITRRTFRANDGGEPRRISGSRTPETL